MRSLTLVALTAALLPACQSPLPSNASMGVTDDSTLGAEVMGELQEVRALLVAAGIRATTGALEPASANPKIQGMNELNGRLGALRESVDRLGAMMAGGSAVGVAAASHGVGQSPEAGDVHRVTAGLLTSGLHSVGEAQALHCENIANAGVSGYKRRVMHFTTDLVGTQGLRAPRPAKVTVSMIQGVLELTGNQLDFGVEGNGFFEIQLPSGELRYTRNGTFRLDVNGRLVTPEGYLLTDRIAIPSDCQGVNVSGDGQVFALGDQNDLSHVGTMRVHTFANATGLKAMGGNYYAPTVSSGQSQAQQPGVQGPGSIKQGYLERSNVKVTDELVELQLLKAQAEALKRALGGYGIYVD